eukprot:6195655-Prymnesium_polylepis.1
MSPGRCVRAETQARRMQERETPNPTDAHTPKEDRRRRGKDDEEVECGAARSRSERYAPCSDTPVAPPPQSPAHSPVP